MTLPEFLKSEKISLKDHYELNEKWVHERIIESPAILGLGDLFVKDKERMQPKAGRLDLLLQDPDTLRRYEVEIQLGKTDESHIIRTIEYWDIERKRYPQYDHCAVIVAEEMTGRFLNVIHLFNGNIPLIAIQMNALSINDSIALTFTTVIDELILGLDEDDDGEIEVTDRSYWENKGSKETVQITDGLLEIIKTFDSGYELKFNKVYIGLSLNGRPNNFALFKAKKKHLRMELKLKPSKEILTDVDEAELDVMEHDERLGKRYRVRLTKSDLNNHQELIKKLLKTAYDSK